ncbi:response regulator [Flavisolibacter tropicus]|nr:response regulator [Flavisolibacter tropicus]
MHIQERYILMLEDDYDDRYFTSEVMKGLDIAVPIRFLSNTDLLFATLEESNPLLIVIDYNLHPETGLEVLQKIRRHPTYQHIPVVILGDTKNPDFVTKCYQCGANTYATKPTTIDATKNKIELFFKYWLEVAETLSPLDENENAENQ